MNLAIVVHPLAERDIVHAWEWYEQQVPGLGDRFVAAIGLAIERAAQWPNAGTPAIHDEDGEVVERRVEPVGFPYAVRYRVDAQLVVMAVYHQRRRPEFGADRSS